MRFYNYDINMLNHCNLACSYCIQDFNTRKPKNIDKDLIKKIIEKFDYLLQNEQFMKSFGGLRISFWGGEPTKALKEVQEIAEYYRNNPYVKFFMYSNGYQYEKVFDFLESFKNSKSIDNDNKFLTQISYDGLASHDVDRLTKVGKGSALKVKETIFELAKRKIPFTVHPTIAAKNFDKIADNYFEFKRMSEVLGQYFNYSPSIDYMSKYNFTKQELDTLTNVLKEQFIKIKEDEIIFYKNNGYFNFGWFNPNRSICTAGVGYAGIELDGKNYACHGVFNENYKEQAIINDINFSNMKFTENLFKYTKEYENYLNYMPKKCQECKTHYCLKCNSTKCAISKKETIGERWTDYPTQQGLCHIFKFIGYFRMALVRVLESQGIQVEDFRNYINNFEEHKI